MSMWAYLYRMFRRYVLSPESFLLLILIFIIYNTLINISPLWERAKHKFGFSLGSDSANDFRADDDNLYWASDPNKASWESKNGLAAVYSIQGRRPHMEDRFKIYTNGSKLAMYGVFDGHGGEFVAEYAQQNLFKNIVSNIKNDEADHHKDVLTKQILDIDEKILHLVKHKADISGSTALVAMVTPASLHVANVGDSRAVMCDKDGKTVTLSWDHKPNETKEADRIKKAGGFIGFNGVWRVAGILATSRALGDYPLKERKFIIADPDILTFDLQKHQPQFIILASDGLWDCFTNEEAVEYIKERLDEPHFGAKSIILQAYYKGSLDNITVMVVKFDQTKFENKGS